jgi:molybdate transport system permease protein
MQQTTQTEISVTADGLEREWHRRFNPNLFWLLLSGSVMLLFLGLPVLVLLGRSLFGGALGQYITAPAVVEALRLSLFTTFLTLMLSVILGTPLAYLLARYRFPGQKILDTLLDLPMVLPPAVAGVALLILLGRRGLIGEWLDRQFGITIGFTTVAVVLAQLFVAAPFYIKAAKAGFESVDSNLETVAASLGSGGWRVFRRITVPLALPALLSGMVMTWARALGEFGATIMFAGSFEGKTQTMPLAIYAAFDGAGGLEQAITLSVILVVVSFAVLITFKLLSRQGIATWSQEIKPEPADERNG